MQETERRQEARYRERIDVGEFFFYLLGYVRQIALTALACAAAAGVAAWLIPGSYAAEARLYVRGLDETGLSVPGLQSGTLLAADYPEVVRAWEVQSLALERLGLDCDWQTLRDMIEVENPAGTRVLVITAHNRDAALAARIANAEAEAACEYFAQVLTVPGAERLSTAPTPTQPEELGPCALAALGAAFGLVAALGVLFFRFAADVSPRTPEDILQACGLETLAVIPDAPRRQDSEGLDDV